jgi:hypothetical protein
VQPDQLPAPTTSQEESSEDEVIDVINMFEEEDVRPAAQVDSHSSYCSSSDEESSDNEISEPEDEADVSEDKQVEKNQASKILRGCSVFSVGFSCRCH